MTDRLNELNILDKSVTLDIEAAESDATNHDLTNFNKEAEAIEKVNVWAKKNVQLIESSLSDPDALHNASVQLDTVETKLGNVRKRLQRISAENKEMAKDQHASPASLRIRVARCTKLANDFIDTVTAVQKARETHRSMSTQAVKNDILRTNPDVSEAQVQHAIDTEQLDSVLQTSNPQLASQLDDLRARNRDIQNLTQSIAQLHQMFTDMSILVEGQQDLINDIEHNVTEVKVETKQAAQELEVALKHQRSARKKKICICVTITVILVLVIGGILIYLGINNGWFSGGGGESDSTSDGAPPPSNTPPATAANPSPAASTNPPPPASNRSPSNQQARPLMDPAQAQQLYLPPADLY